MPARFDFGSVRGVRVGQAETADGGSGVTVALFERAVPTVLDVRGGAPATYDTASLSLDATYGGRWAIFFSGGSLYGLDAARGIRTRLLEEGRGHTAFRNPNPVVPISGAALFDLPARRGPIPDYLPLGYEAARRATTGRVAVGRVGAGAGATVGKYLGRDRAMRGGVGAAAERVAGLGAVGVLVAVNAVGAVRDPASGRWEAGARSRSGRVTPPGGAPARSEAPSATTLGLAVCELEVSRPTLARVATMANTGLATAIVPFHSSTDGDVVFACSTGVVTPRRREPRPGDVADRLGSAAARLAVIAVRRAVRAANSRA